MKKILLIDDEEDFCFFLRNNLELIGNYEVISMTEGENGLSAAQLYKPDLILLDIRMPGINGLEILKKIRKDNKTKSIPVIILTSKDDEDSRLCAKNLCITDYIMKPFGIDGLKSKIENVLPQCKR